jgi:hypothetical protein
MRGALHEGTSRATLHGTLEGQKHCVLRAYLPRPRWYATWKERAAYRLRTPLERSKLLLHVQLARFPSDTSSLFSSNAHCNMEHSTEHLIAGIANAQAPNGTHRYAQQTGQKRKRNHEDVPWTASRCNRLLRSITSRISILQRLDAANRLKGDGWQDRPSNGRAHAEHGNSRPGNSSTTAPSPSKDPEWLPRTGREVVLARTYGGRAKQRRLATAGASRSDHGAPALTTPFVKRMLSSNGVQSPNSPVAARAEAQNRAEQNRKRPQIPVKPNTTAAEACQNLTKALESFLKATQRPVNKPRRGAATLMSACLRNVPAYVREVEHEAEAEDEEEDESDATYQVYEWLEQELGASSKGGWLGLREVVRAHGIWHISEALKAKLLPKKISERLIEICDQQDAVTEAWPMLEAMVRTEVDTGLDEMLPFAWTHKSFGRVFTFLRELLESGDVLFSNLMGHYSLWHMLMDALLQDNGLDEAVAFLARCVYLAGEDSSLQLPTSLHKKLQKTIQLVAAKAAKKETPPSLIQALHRIATYTIVLRPGPPAGPYAKDGYPPDFPDTMFWLTSVLFHLLGHPTPQDLTMATVEQLVNRLSLSAGIVGKPHPENNIMFKLPNESFLSEIARMLSLTDPATADNLLFIVVRRLLQLAEQRPDPISAATLAGLTLDAAKAYAQGRKSKASLMFAEEVEDTVVRHLTGASTPAPNGRVKRDWRWEEGLCEWVAKTPGSAQLLRKAVKQRDEQRIMEVDEVAEVAEETTTLVEPKAAAPIPKASGAKSSSQPKAKASPVVEVLPTAARDSAARNPRKRQRTASRSASSVSSSSDSEESQDEILDFEADERDELALSARKPRTETAHKQKKAKRSSAGAKVPVFRPSERWAVVGRSEDAAKKRTSNGQGAAKKRTSEGAVVKKASARSSSSSTRPRTRGEVDMTGAFDDGMSEDELLGRAW